MHLMYLMAITAARKSIDLANSYFVPAEIALQALADAARRGVKVRVLTPSGAVLTPEYEACRTVAERHGVPLQAVYDAVRRADGDR